MAREAGRQEKEQNRPNRKAVDTGAGRRSDEQEHRSDQERSIASGSEVRGPAGRGMQRREGGSEGRRYSVHPLASMFRMAEDMDRLFEQFGFDRGMGSSALLRGGSQLADWAPQLEILERKGKLVVRADVPGVSRDDVDIRLENDILTISGERRDERDEEEGGVFRSERSYGRFFRSIQLPEGIDGDACDASFSDGVLEITIPFKEQRKREPRRIPVR